MSKSIEELIPLVHKWAEEREIFEKSNSTKQLEKTREEVNELIRDLKTPRIFENIEDDLGDICVTLILYSHMKELNFKSILTDCEYLFDKTKKYTPRQLSKNVDSVMLELTRLEVNNGHKIEIINKISILLTLLLHSCVYINKPLNECLLSAYNVISKRKGKIIDGKFVKDK